MDVNVLIIGLGPAGATVLSKLAQIVGSEKSILAIDHRAKPGFPVQCGEFMPSPEEMASLMPAVPNSREFFAFDEQYISQRTKTISFVSPQGKVIQTPFEGYSLHRGKWITDLIETGKKKGAEVWTSACAVNMENTRITIVQSDKTQIQINPQVIVGADGVNSKIAQWIGLNEKRSDKDYVIVKQHVMTNIDTDYDPTDIQMFFGDKYSPGAYSWIIPKNNNTVNVGAGVRIPMLRGKMNVSKALTNLIEEHPTASQILKGARIDKTIAGVVPVGLPFQNTVDVKSQSLLVGDAASQIVSSVGGGIPPSMVAGSIAATTIADFLDGTCSLTEYQTRWWKSMLNVLIKSYKLRQFFDKISSGRDSRIQWYMNRLKSGDINKVVHCAVPWKVTLAYPFVRYLNWIIT
ncbi:MAG: NAD(P)/FAD-dependent oxidoreductase [Candidatus Heimdallarchaeota archaeon]|nr:MAG: NAD(P)/FAD-dependent oxidoreductase [Candidatus Heimdallarchaeota archaeon]